MEIEGHSFGEPSGRYRIVSAGLSEGALDTLIWNLWGSIFGQCTVARLVLGGSAALFANGVVVSYFVFLFKRRLRSTKKINKKKSPCKSRER